MGFFAKKRNDYYPFGMLLPNRHGYIEDYRYGFGGQEKDDEIRGEGNSLNYTFRMHDSRIGRFFTPDPLEAKFPNYSPYMFAGNRVILFTELEGLEETIPAIQNTINARELYNPKLDMDMSKVGSNAATINGNKTVASTYTVKNGVRNYIAYWNKQLEVNPQMFDPANTARIKNGAAPTVNDQWIKHNSAHADYKGDKLVHHHKFQGKVATAIPQSAHQKFTKVLHPFRRLKSGIANSLKNGNIKGRIGKVGTVLSVITAPLEILSDSPSTMWNQTYGNGLNVGQLYQQLGETGPITGAYYMINSQENSYDSKGNIESVSTSITEYYMDYNKAKGELEIRQGATNDYIQNKGESQAQKRKRI